MEIRTTRPDVPEQGGPPPEPESSRYLRRQAPQRVRKPNRLGRVLRVAARTGLKLGVAAATLALAGVFVYWALHSDSFSLRSVTVRGCSKLDPRAVEMLVKDAFQGNLVAMDLSKVRRKVESVTWVRSAVVRRILPSEIVVEIEERVPSVILELQGELMLADRDGVLLDRYDDRQDRIDAPVFCGMAGHGAAGYRASQEENSARVRLGIQLLEELDGGSPAYARNISEIDLADRQNVRVLLVDDTAEILLGDRDFLERFRKLMNNIDQYREVKERFTDIAWVDLRYDTQIIYMPRKEGAERTAPGGVPLH